uniref:Uncharacterized protein n=1 Tax=Cacopsylla melanoneura TaxID=428564 RepID=A0A8D8ZQM8_9HEMI
MFCSMNTLFCSTNTLFCFMNTLFSSMNTLFCSMNTLFCSINTLYCVYILKCIFPTLFLFIFSPSKHILYIILFIQIFSKGDKISDPYFIICQYSHLGHICVY